MYTDLNADAGEAYGLWQIGDDSLLFRELTSVNLALGFHAGDPVTLQATTTRAAQLGLGIGAHPGYPDLRGFGRRALELTPEEIYADVVYQIGALLAFLQVSGAGAPLQHVKAHGALYTRTHTDPRAGEALCRAVADLTPDAGLIALAGPAGEALTRQAHAHGLRVWREAFPERAYAPDGHLASRALPGSSIHDPDIAAGRALEMVRGRVTAHGGAVLHMQVDTLCIHGDNPQASALAQAVRACLTHHGVGLRAMGAGPA